VELKDDAHDVALVHDQVLDTLDLDLLTGPFSEQNAVTHLDAKGLDPTLVIACPCPDGDDLTFLRPLLSRVGNNDAVCGSVVLIDAPEDDAVMQWPEIHWTIPCKSERKRLALTCESDNISLIK
jgi:hypothetical protein